MVKKLRWGILSTGTITHQFVSDFKFVSNATVVAVASRDQSKADEFARQYGIERAYGSYEALYADPNIDAIYIATPHNFHFQNTLDALNAGKSVLCEKPITTCLKDAEKLFEVATATGNYLIEGMWTYFLPAIQKAQQWIAEGKIGDVRQVKADFGYPVPYDPNGRMFNPELAGGSLFDMGIYPVAMAHLFLKDYPDDIQVFSTQAPTGVDYEVAMLFKYQEASALLNTSFRCKLPNYTYVIGTEGYIEIHDFWRAGNCKRYRGEQCAEEFGDNRFGNGFEFEIEAVSKEILEGKKISATVTEKDSFVFQSLMEEVRNNF